MSNNPNLVSIEWLFDHLQDSNTSIVDGSWYLPTMKVNGTPRIGKTEYLSRHIPGAIFFDIDEVTEPDSGLPHTLASADRFAAMVGAMGISDQDTIVVYDGMGLFSAPRVWWNFKMMGASKVYILDGGLPAWENAGLPITSKVIKPETKQFNAVTNHKLIASFQDMQGFVSTKERQIADARPADRFSGAQPEPREGIRSGHMPGALSLPFSALAQDGRLHSKQELEVVFENAGLDLEKPIVTSCGSGVTAAALALALETIGHTDHTLYDGSWAEWGSRQDTEVITDG